DRADASRAALRELGSTGLEPSAGALSPASQGFIVHRAERLLARVRARAPAVGHALALAGGFTWLGRVVLIIAFAFGVSLSALDGSRRINILAFPLIGLIAWILVVYALLLTPWLSALRRSQTVRARPATRAYSRWIAARIEALLRRSTRFNV